MSCSTANSPIDITDKNSGVCELKCKYMFKYNDSSIRINNKGDYLLLSYDKPTTEPVVYNSVPYHVEELRIYSPSLHSYSGSKADAELIIIHTNDYNQKLLVCIPIVSSTNQMGPLELIISTASKFANTKDKSTFITKTMNLNSLIPSKKMYIYNGTFPFPPCNGENDIITFSKNDGAYVSISRDSLTLLNGIIKKNSIQIQSNTFFVNNKGPQSLSLDSSGEIYIDCKPVSDDGDVIDSSTEELESPISGIFSKIDYKSIVNSPILQVIMSIIGAFLIYKLFFFIIDKTKSDEIKNKFPIQIPSLKTLTSNFSNIKKKPLNA